MRDYGILDTSENDIVLEAIENPNANILSILEIPTIYPMLKEENSELTKYFHQKMAEILDLICDDGDSTNTIKSFLLFRKAHKSFTQGLITNDFLFTAATQVLSRPRLGTHVISRLATLILLSITQFPKQSAESLGFIYQLLPFCGEPGVFDLFHGICDPLSDLHDAQQRLVETNFQFFVISELESKKIGSNFETIASLVRIIRESCLNEILSKSFLNEQTLTILFHILQEIHKFPPDKDPIGYKNLRGQLWWAIYAASSPETSLFLSQFSTYAIEIIEEAYPIAEISQIFALEFLAKLIKLSYKSISDRIDPELIQVVTRILLQYPDSSNYIGAAFRFIRSGIKVKAIQKLFLLSFIPLICCEAEGPRSSLAAHCADILSEISSLKGNNQEVDSLLNSIDIFREYARPNGPMSLRKKILSSHYGGEVNAYIGSTILNPFA